MTSDGTDGGPANDGGPDTLHLYAWLARDPHGVEGVVVYPTDYGFMPLLTTDEAVAHSYEPHARQVGKARHSPVYLVAFARGAELSRITPPAATGSA